MWGSIISGGIAAAASLIGASRANSAQAAQADKANSLTAQQFDRSLEYNSAEAVKARQFNASEAKKSRLYNTYMSNTAIQRQIADLKAAGLNPILAARGDGAPQGSSAQASAPSASSSGGGSYQQAQIRDVISSAVSSAIGAMSAVNQTRQTESQVDLQRTQGDLNRSSITTQEVDRYLKESHIDVNNKQQSLIMKQIDKLDQEITESISRVKNLTQDEKIKKAEAVIRSYEASITEQLRNLGMGKDAVGILAVIKSLLMKGR